MRGHRGGGTVEMKALPEVKPFSVFWFMFDNTIICSGEDRE